MTDTPSTGEPEPRFQSPYLDADEAAIYLRMERRTFDNLRYRGLGPRFRKHGGRVCYHIADLDAWSDARGKGDA